jgi:hypothetical protein
MKPRVYYKIQQEIQIDHNWYDFARSKDFSKLEEEIEKFSIGKHRIVKVTEEILDKVYNK